MTDFANQLQQALKLHQQGQLDAALQQYERLLKQQPNSADVLHLRGLIEHQRGHFAAAVPWIQKAIQVEPKVAVYHANIAEALRQADRIPEAVQHLNQAVSLDPNFAPAFNSLGIVSRLNGDYDQSLKFYKRALLLNPKLADAHINLGLLYRDLGDHKAALKHCQEGLKLAPRNAAGFNNLANVHKDLGQIDEAIVNYQKAIELNPSFGQAYSNLSQSRRHNEELRGEVEKMEQVLAKVPLSDDSKSHVHFAIGKAYDDLKEYDKAFPHFAKGNSIIPLRFATDKFVAYVDSIIATYNQQFFDNNSIRGSESEFPVFIIGMPRSGTSLIEQILASHPQAAGVGERKEIALILPKIDAHFKRNPAYPMSMPQYTAEMAKTHAEQYEKDIRRQAGSVDRIVDKMMTNFLHVGLISLLYPNAKIIHSIRHPLDTCLSCYFQDFSHRPAHTFDLKTLGLYYRQYVRVTEHWQKSCPLEILDVHYEQVVNDSEATCRKMVEHCGLAWNDACLDFHKTERVVQTASSWQVRQPINKRSVERWRHYDDQLGALKDALGDLLNGE
ncbi:MAG: tetratricopeptide (TPR) repeat protein [Pirellulaceae bacterium]|jgi:tetratricopeptide (TPR) repeat protein